MLVNVLAFILAINVACAAYVAFLLLFHGRREVKREDAIAAERLKFADFHSATIATKPVTLADADELMNLVSVDELMRMGRPNRGCCCSAIPGTNGERHDN